jgi:hypothetical protein
VIPGSRRSARRGPGWRWSIARSRLPVGLLLLLLLAPCAAALETDQYYAWGRSLEDSTAIINAKLGFELEQAAEELGRTHGPVPPDCEEVAARLHERLHFSTFQNFELWALKTDLLARAPADATEELAYRETNLYRDHGLFDVGTWLPNSPTIEVAGIRLGTDKLAHFVSSGWRWYQNYLTGLRAGLHPAAAELRMIRDGVFWERTMLGGTASGVMSRADLEANFQGKRFYEGLCHGNQPSLALVEGRWRVAHPFDIAGVVGPEWDESYQTSVYSPHRWRRVRPVLETYCDRLALPSVQAQRRWYREVERVTPVERVVQQLVDQGKVRDPRQFSIEANCPSTIEYEAFVQPATPIPGRGPSDPVDGTVVELVVDEHEADRGARGVGLLGVYLGRPERLAVSGGVILVRLPVALDCSTVCPIKGPALQMGVGLGGGRLSLGWAHVVGDTRGKRLFVSDPYIGIGGKGTLLYTWGEPVGEPAGAAFLGGELEFTIVQVNFRLGALYHVGGSARGGPWLLSAGVGWGF